MQDKSELAMKKNISHGRTVVLKSAVGWRKVVRRVVAGHPKQDGAVFERLKVGNEEIGVGRIDERVEVC